MAGLGDRVIISELESNINPDQTYAILISEHPLSFFIGPPVGPLVSLFGTFVHFVEPSSFFEPKS